MFCIPRATHVNREERKITVEENSKANGSTMRHKRTAYSPSPGQNAMKSPHLRMTMKKEKNGAFTI